MTNSRMIRTGYQCRFMNYFNNYYCKICFYMLFRSASERTVITTSSAFPSPPWWQIQLPHPKYLTFTEPHQKIWSVNKKESLRKRCQITYIALSVLMSTRVLMMEQMFFARRFINLWISDGKHTVLRWNRILKLQYWTSISTISNI